MLVLVPPYRKKLLADILSGLDPYFQNVLIQMHMNGQHASQTIVNNGIGTARVLNGNGILNANTKAFGTSSFMGNVAGTGISVAPPAAMAFSPYHLANFDFTMECFVLRNSATIGTIMGTFRWYIGYRGGYMMQIAANGALSFTIVNGTSLTTAAGVVPVGQWTHIAVSRQGTTWRFFVNGTLVYTVSNSTLTTVNDGAYSQANQIHTADEFRIGFYPTEQGFAQPFDGYIDELRVTKGVARYTDSFAKPTSEYSDGMLDQYVAKVSSVMHFENYKDSKTGSDGSIVGTNVALTAECIAGTRSLSLGGTGYLQMPNTGGAYDLGTGDFTVEVWMKTTQNATGYKALIGTQSIAGNNVSGMWRISTSLNGVPGLYFNYTAINRFFDLQFSTTNLHDGKWHHIAAVRIAGGLHMFIDGVEAGAPIGLTASLSSGQPLNIGYQPQDGHYWTGLVDEMRVTKDVGRYTTTFPILPVQNTTA